MHLLITGHTGFKGSWLAVLAKELGHKVSGLSLAPVADGAFVTANLVELFEHHVICDIRDRPAVESAIDLIRPDAIIHMAAQPLVIEGYRDPAGTFEVNVDGTRNVLEAARRCNSVKSLLVVTTDKVYKDTGVGAFSESDSLGGHDPYSASKAMADLLAQSYANLGLDLAIGIARAGNVIGRGDVSADRLIPDIIKSHKSGTELTLRLPSAVRPWQHVLDCINGYLLALEYLSGEKPADSGALILNFGPEPTGYKTVSEVVSLSRQLLGRLRVIETPGTVRETSFLTLNSSQAREILGWQDKLDFEKAVAWSLADAGKPLNRELMQHQVRSFLAIVHTAGLSEMPN
jgi:CDP-glucose 4,6-dehydratase